MKNKMKRIAMFLFAFVISISTVAPLQAASGTITNGSSAGNLFEANGAGPKTDHTSCTYAIDGAPAWCIEAGIDVIQGEGYTNTNFESIDGTGALSYLMYNSTQMGGPIDNQLVQAAIWKLTGNNVWSVGGDMAQVDTVIAQAQAANSGMSAPSAGISVSGNNEFTYTRNYGSHGTVYLTNPITFTNASSVTIGGGPAGTQFVDGNGNAVGGTVGSGTFRVMVPATAVTSDMHITVNASSNATAQGYGPAHVWRKAGSQTLITPTRSTITGGGSSAGFNLTALGDLKIAKNDEWNKPVVNATFQITGPHGYSNTITTRADGTFELQGLRIGTYTITETNVGQNLYISNSSMNVQVTVQSGKVITYNGLNEYKRGSAQLQKLDSYEGKTPKGDSKLEGATYNLYAAETIKEGSTIIFEADQLVATVKTDVNGITPVVENVKSTVQNKNIDGLPVGNYYWKEMIPSPGFNLNEDIVNITVVNDKDLYTAELTKNYNEHLEIPIKGKVTVYKMDNDDNNDETQNDTDKNSAAGAELRLTLISDPSEFYDVVIDENGFAEFVDEDFKNRYPDKEFTIPFGQYTITETKASDKGEHTYYYIQPTNVNINEEEELEQRILMDEPVPVNLKLIKVDEDNNNAIVKIAGAQFKIWDCQNNEFVSQKIYPSGEYIDVFETNAEGYFYTPEQLFPGKYILYEVKAPAGYYLDPKYKLPAQEDIGVEGKAGLVVEIDKEAAGLEEDAEYPEGGVPAGTLIYESEIGNTPLKGKIEIKKVGEKLTEVTTAPVEITEELTDEKYTPIYSNVGLEGVVYKIYAAEDIKTPDGTGIYVTKGDLVDTITTGEDGIATSKDLYLGEYRIEEDYTPEGYIKDENIENVVLENDDETVKVKTTTKELSNIRQKLKLTFKKDYVGTNYSDNEKAEKWAIFGVYAAEAIDNYKGVETIPENALLDVIKVEGEEQNVTSNVDLPAGKYYVCELDASTPYVPSSDKLSVELKHEGTTEEYLTIEMEGLTNDYDKANITLIKLSTTTLGNVVMDGKKLESEEKDEQIEKILNDIKTLTEDQAKAYLEENHIKFVAGAEYSIFLDEACSTPLYVRVGETDEFEPAKLVTDDTGLIKIEGLPIGMYYLKETYAPLPYVVSDNVVKIELTREQKDATVYSALVDDSMIGEPFTKVDAFTGETIPNCVFEIRDMEDNVLLHSVTDKNGEGSIPIDILTYGEEYQLVEIEAPGIYDLNTEPHIFKAEYTIDPETGKVTWEEKTVVDNRRKTIKELIVRKVDDKTDEPLEGCRFSIIMIDDKGNPIKHPNGEQVYLVQDAVTGKDGEYRVETPEYGTYQFIEVEAPEGYEMKEDMNGLTFKIGEESPDTIIFEVTNTGDIAVYALTAIAIVSVLGIVYVVSKNKKQRV